MRTNAWKTSQVLTGRIAIVTGASSGIGAATARELGRQGATVVLAARRLPDLQAQAQSVEAAGGVAMPVACDVGEASQVRRLTELTLARFGQVDVLVNCAGANWTEPLSASQPDDVARLVGVNLLGTMLLTRAVLPGMLARGQGAIISVGSLAGRVAIEPVYSATKFAMRGFSLGLRRQLSSTGISVSLVSPGNIRTSMTSQVSGRLPGPEIVATTIAGLIYHPRREVVVPRKHYILAWLEQGLPSVADLAHRRRHWSPAWKEEAALWRS
jgi:NADP-dependent 3-hydroxy acid dehydrogenase YdfG